MPHLVIHYTPNAERQTDFGALCQSLADTILSIRDAAGAAVYPPTGTRVMAYPAAHSVVADGRRDYAFVYLNFRIAKGRSDEVKRATGDALLEVVKRHFATQLANDAINVTLQIDESQTEVYHGQHSNFKKLFP